MGEAVSPFWAAAWPMAEVEGGRSAGGGLKKGRLAVRYEGQPVRWPGMCCQQCTSIVQACAGRLARCLACAALRRAALPATAAAGQSVAAAPTYPTPA